MLLILFSISLCFSWVSSDRNKFMVMYLATSGTTDLPEYVGVGMIDGVPVAYYDSSAPRIVSRQQWMTDAFDEEYWEYLTNRGNKHCAIAKENLKTIMKSTNQTSDPDRMRWVASNHFAVKTAEKWNSDKAWNKYWKWQLEIELVERLKLRLHFGKEYLKRKVQPEVFISRNEPNHQDKPLTLSCLVTGFYPVDIKVTWLRNGEVVSEIQSSGIRPNHDGTHQIQKEIEISAGDEDQYSCRIEHSSLAEAKLYQWENPGNGTRHLHLEITGFVIIPLAVIVGIIILVMWKRTQRDKTRNLQQQCQRNSEEEHQTIPTQPFLETEPTLHQ
ncbi:class I histocompatibility antigen, F10 alpha chain-like isoform X3 [Stegostoma tigrinum]|uniref:class I histocompatibility antigen, F10 alpha chain-like isoform X3 n=1 Tax=Stegostoma tigrinum TaxID=3053191 RepID=UPI00202ADE78|nr:class I histocompatibility antigen, F10 alpha chain-like isoform X3 [Stegostoma tigrinum]